MDGIAGIVLAKDPGWINHPEPGNHLGTMHCWGLFGMLRLQTDIGHWALAVHQADLLLCICSRDCTSGVLLPKTCHEVGWVSRTFHYLSDQ